MKWKYISAIIIVIVLQVAFISIQWYWSMPNEFLAEIPSTIALIIAIVSLSLADPKQKSMNIRVDLWGRNRINGDNPRNIVLNIVNKGDNALYKPKFHIRAPKKIFPIDRSDRKQKYEIYEYGETVLKLNDQFHFLGTSNGDNSIRFDHRVDFSDWKKGNIYLSIHCENYKVNTYKITSGELSTIREAIPGNPIQLSEN